MNCIVQGSAWKALRLLASHYLCGGLASWYVYDVSDITKRYKPANRTRDDAENLPAYKVISELLNVEHNIIANSRYPSEDYSFDKRVFIQDIGFIRFVVFPKRQAPNGAGFLRFYIECPACGKLVPCGRFHQHKQVHSPEWWVEKTYANATLYRLREPVTWFDGMDDRFERTCRSILIRHENGPCTIVYATSWRNETDKKLYVHEGEHNIQLALTSFIAKREAR